MTRELATFHIETDGTAVYGNTRLQWRAVPQTSAESLNEALSGGDTALIIKALKNFAGPLSRQAEHLLASRLRDTTDANFAAAAALRLGNGALTDSIDVLKTTYATMFDKGEYIVAMELAAALFKRNKPKYFRHLLAHFASRGGSFDGKALSELVGLSLLRDLPARHWPTAVLAKLPRSGPARFVTARVLLAKRLREGRRIIVVALFGHVEVDRERAINSFGQVQSITARRLLRKAFESERNLELKLLCAEYLKAAVPVERRINLVMKGRRQESPVVRYRSARQLQWLPKGQRRRVADPWLETESDEVVRDAVRRWL